MAINAKIIFNQQTGTTDGTYTNQFRQFTWSYRIRQLFCMIRNLQEGVTTIKMV